MKSVTGILVILALTACSATESANTKSLAAETAPATGMPTSLAGSQTVRYDDMLVTLPKASGGFQAQATIFPQIIETNLWPGGVIPVVFEGLASSNKDKFFKACAAWGAGTIIRCIPRTTEKGYALITMKESGCFASYGNNGMGATTVNLGAGCWTQPYIVHELGHLLGLTHEHQRPDRDNYIDIFSVNARAGTQLGIFTGLKNLGPYDFESAMHYPRKSNSVNGKDVILPKPQFAQYNDVIGLHSVPSTGDIAAINMLYGNPSTGVAPITSNTPTNVPPPIEPANQNDNPAEDNPVTTTPVTPVTPPVDYTSEIQTSYYKHLPGCLNDARLVFWKDWFKSPQATVVNFRAGLEAASAPETIAGCADWSTAGRMKAIEYYYNRYLPGCFSQARADFWYEWFNHPSALGKDFIVTLQQSATPQVLESCKAQ